MVQSFPRQVSAEPEKLVVPPAKFAHLSSQHSAEDYSLRRGIFTRSLNAPVPQDLSLSCKKSNTSAANDENSVLIRLIVRFRFLDISFE